MQQGFGLKMEKLTELDKEINEYEKEKREVKRWIRSAGKAIEYEGQVRSARDQISDLNLSIKAAKASKKSLSTINKLKHESRSWS